MEAQTMAADDVTKGEHIDGEEKGSSSAQAQAQVLLKNQESTNEARMAAYT